MEAPESLLGTEVDTTGNDSGKVIVTHNILASVLNYLDDEDVEPSAEAVKMVLSNLELGEGNIEALAIGDTFFVQCNDGEQSMLSDLRRLSWKK